jgi:hypothetical protein
MVSRSIRRPEIRPLPSDNDVGARQRVQPRKADDEVGNPVAVNVAVHESGAVDLLVTELAGRMAEGTRADEIECLVAAGERIRIDEMQVDLVALSRVEIGDLVGSAASPSSISPRGT